jgi:thioredoxin-like negative regulator of GroEL
MAGKSRKQQIEEMLAEDPNDPFLNYGLAMEHVGAGQDQDAVGRFEHLIQIAPDYVPAYLQAAQASVRLNRTSDAREFLATGMEAAQKKGDQHAYEEMAALLASLA